MFEFSNKGSAHWSTNVEKAEQLRQDFIDLCKKYGIHSAAMGVARLDDKAHPDYPEDVLHPLFISNAPSRDHEVEVVELMAFLLQMSLQEDSRLLEMDSDEYKQMKNYQQSIDNLFNKKG